MPDMLVRLYDLPEVAPLVEALDEQGIVIRRAMPYEKHAVVDWVRDSFGDAWASECDVAFSNHPASCFLATETGQIVGFACHDSTCRDFFGPTGVAEPKRGLGIGKALTLSCLHAMASHGYAYAIIGGGGPTAFYAKTVGAVPIEGSTPGIYRDPLRKSDANMSSGGDGRKGRMEAYPGLSARGGAVPRGGARDAAEGQAGEH